MRYLIISLLFLLGCSPSSDLGPSDQNTFVFSVGDKVHTKLHLYSNCDGVVTGYTQWADRYGNHVNVSFYCPNVGWLKEDVTILESSLIRDKE
jgi:hypothetical protein